MKIFYIPWDQGIHLEVVRNVCIEEKKGGWGMRRATKSMQGNTKELSLTVVDVVAVTVVLGNRVLVLLF